MSAVLSCCFCMFLPHDKSWNTPMLKMKTLNPTPNFSSSLALNCHSPTTSEEYQFRVSYLVDTFGLSLETAEKTSKLARFKTSENPDSVILVLRNSGFSDSQIKNIICKAPNILAGNPYIRILPKFDFFLSKGASHSDVVEIVTRSPRILYASLENCIIPTYELIRTFFPSNEKLIKHILKYKLFFGHYSIINNVKLLLDYGVTHSNIRHLLIKRPSILLSHDMRSALDMVRNMGFEDPSHINFHVALLALKAISKSRWDDKVNAFKSWGWSDEMVLEAFRKQPMCMLSSTAKINKVMSFFVNDLGWNSSYLVKRAYIFQYSLENRIIPRAFVVSYLVSKGLMEKNAELLTPIFLSEEMFLEKYVQCFIEERHNLLKLYLEKMDDKKIKENGEASESY